MAGLFYCSQKQQLKSKLVQAFDSKGEAVSALMMLCKNSHF